MQPLLPKTSFLRFTFVVLASAIGFLTACSATSQSQSQASNTPVTEAGNMKGHDMGSGSGGSMDHSMAMDLGPADASYDLRFLDAMTPHHQGAVEMAKVAQQESQRPEIQQLASNIIKDQNKEIAQLKQWRQAWYPKAGNQPVAYDTSQGHMMPMSSDQMKSMMMQHDLGAANAEFDLRFIDAMIPHHEGAITMAKDALSKSRRPEIKKLAQDILTSQQKEINQMKQWRQAWYKQ